MESFKLNYLHLCDAATADSNGKVNILGIFDKLYLSNLPSRYQKFTLVSSLTIYKLASEIQILQIKILDSNKTEIKLDNPIQLELQIDKENFKKNANVNLILDIANVEFSKYGKHSLNIYINNHLIGSTNLSVEERIAN
jgi:hypothetical protein